jgi:rubrerythrin
MLEIKTITERTPTTFDYNVNEALAEGWELVRRECFVTGADRAITLYAELERVIDEPEEEYEGDEDDMARWEITRNPTNPFRCSKCGYTASEQWLTCPDCKRAMVKVEV